MSSATQSEGSLLGARSKVKRSPHRATYKARDLHQVLEAGIMCHVAVEEEFGPVCIPMVYGRIDETVYLHGALGSRLLRRLAGGAPGCVTVTMIDGLVVARSAFNHTVNYRAAVLFGTMTVVEDPEEKIAGLKAVLEHNLANSWSSVRPPTKEELDRTRLVALRIEEASVKIRSLTDGSPDDEEDLGLDLWGGVIPVEQQFGIPIPDSTALGTVEVPEHIASVVGRRITP